MGEMSKKFVNILFLVKYYILGEAMKRALFIILVTFLLVLILIYFYDERELVLNKKYYNDNFQTMRFSQLSDSKKNLFSKQSRMNYIKMSSSSFHKSNSSKKNYISESYLSNN